MWRLAEKKDINMKLSRYSRMEKDTYVAVEASDREYIKAMLSISDMALSYDDGKARCLMGVIWPCGFWLMFGEVESVPPSFFKGMRAWVRAFAERYGYLHTYLLMDKETLPEIKVHMMKICGLKPCPTYEKNGHKWAESEVYSRCV